VAVAVAGQRVRPRRKSNKQNVCTISTAPRFPDPPTSVGVGPCSTPSGPLRGQIPRECTPHTPPSRSSGSYPRRAWASRHSPPGPSSAPLHPATAARLPRAPRTADTAPRSSPAPPTSDARAPPQPQAGRCHSTKRDSTRPHSPPLPRSNPPQTSSWTQTRTAPERNYCHPLVSARHYRRRWPPTRHRPSPNPESAHSARARSSPCTRARCAGRCHD
jgi:hypothetical protein